MFFLKYLDVNVKIVMFYRATAFFILMEEEYLEAQKFCTHHILQRSVKGERTHKLLGFPGIEVDIVSLDIYIS